MDISAFRGGLEQANTKLEQFKRVVTRGDIGNGLKQMLGAGAVVQAIRETIRHAQDARSEAGKLGRTVDENTAAVARYGDAWQTIKTKIADAAVVGLAALNKLGERAATSLMSPARQRVLDISETAAANADRLSTPEAREAAKQRGEARTKTDDDEMKRVAGAMNKGMELREKARTRELTDGEQLAKLEQARIAFAARFNDARLKAADRADALVKLGETENALLEKRAEIQKKAEDTQQKDQDRLRRRDEKVRAAEADFSAAQYDMDRARLRMAKELRDALGYTVAEAASGRRGTRSDQLKANRILEDEDRARRLHDSGRSVTLYGIDRRNPKLGPRNFEAGPEYYQKRAVGAREEMGGLTDAERFPFADAAAQLTAAADNLSQVGDRIVDVLENAEVTVDESASSA